MSSSDYRLSARAKAAKASEIRELLKLVGKPTMISFAGGIPDPSLLGIDLVDAALRNIFSGPASAREAIQYSTTEGYAPLREWIAAYMKRKGVDATPDNILITSGSQQALDLIGRLMLDPGDTVLVSRPSYLGALQCFTAHGATFAQHDLPLSVSGTAPTLTYLIPDFANPSGHTMTREERLAALERAEQLDTVIVEDAAYTELRYEGEAVAPIAALDIERSGSIDASRTLYCGTFSKTLTPGLRVGWVCGPAALVQRLALLKQGADLHTATLNQIAIHHAAVTGFVAVVARARATYVIRRDAMLFALDRYAPEGMSWTRPNGGMFIWVTLPEHIDTRTLLKQAITQDVAFVPGGAFHADGTGHNTMRLSFSLCDEAHIEIGIYKLCTLISSVLGQAAKSA